MSTFFNELVQGRNIIGRRAGDSFHNVNFNRLDRRLVPASYNFIDPSYFNSNWKLKDMVQGKQDSGPVYPILTPSGPDTGSDTGSPGNEVIPPTENEISQAEPTGPVIRPAEPYLYDFDFIMDFGGIIMRSITRDLPVAPLVGLSRNIVESEQCAEYVSCGTSKFSLRHDTFNWLHNFLVDFPFKGDLADRLKSGSTRAADKSVTECDFKCNPIATLTRGLSVLETLQKVVRITNNL